jgi:hypothetical protein
MFVIVFSEQVGEKSQLATEINAIAITYSTFYARQSNRDMPITQFSNGIQQGKLMAKEYPGVLLLMAKIEVNCWIETSTCQEKFHTCP